MAIIRLAALIEEMSGKIGGQSISNYSQFTTIKNIVQPTKIPTTKQSTQRNVLTQISNIWQFLTTPQRNAWAATAINYTYINRVDEIITRNGYQVFSFCNQNLSVISQSLISNAPLYIPVTEPKINILDISSGNFEIGSNNASSDYLYAIFGVANLSFGQKATASRLRLIAVITSVQLNGGYDVVSDMENVFGDLSFPNKMGITIDPINETTGNRNQDSQIIENVETPFILEVTVLASDTVTIPFTIGGVFSGDISWGDGTSDTFASWNDANLIHNYPNDGDYVIQLTGSFPRFDADINTFENFLTNITQFGSNTFTALSFENCLLLTAVTPNDTPTLGVSCSLFHLVRSCLNITQFDNIQNWDTSLVTNMRGAFRATDFQPDVSNWNISLVTTMQDFLFSANSNPDVSNWIPTALASMFSFSENNPLVPDITSWVVPALASVRNAFRNDDAITTGLATLDVSNVTDFSATFQNANNYNEDLSTWDISSAILMANFGANSNFSDANWDAMLIAWNALAVPPPNITIGINATHTAAANAAFANLIATHGWTINEAV